MCATAHPDYLNLCRTVHIGHVETRIRHTGLDSQGSDEVQYRNTQGGQAMENKDNAIDREYFSLLERNDNIGLSKLVHRYAKEKGFSKKVYRVDSYSGNGTEYHDTEGVFYTDSLDYYLHSDTGYSKDDAKEYLLRTGTRMKVFDPMGKYGFRADTWSAIWGPCRLFTKWGLENQNEDAEEDDEEGVTDTDSLAQIGKELGYDYTILRDIPNDMGYGELYTEFAVYDSCNVKPTEPILHYPDGTVIPLSKRFTDSYDMNESAHPSSSSGNIGYRYEGLYGSGVRNLVDVMSYEVIELGNDDILETVLGNFSMGASDRKAVQDALDGGEDRRKAVNACLRSIRKEYPQARYALWLCDSPEDVISSYSNDGDEPIGRKDIDAYRKGHTKPISDLDDEGKLWVYDEMPKAL